MFSVGVTTCDRGKPDYTSDALVSMWMAGWSDVWMSYDGPTFLTEERRGCELTVRTMATHELPIPLGPKVNFKFMLYHLTSYCEPWVIVFQDDIRIAKGLSEWLERNLPGEGVVSLYTSTPHDGPDGWNEVCLKPADGDPWPWRNCLGACAIAMPCDIAKRYVENDPQPERTDRIGSSLGQFCHLHDIPFWTHSPSLVQHVGEVSAVRCHTLTPERVALRFCEDVKDLNA